MTQRFMDGPARAIFPEEHCNAPSASETTFPGRKTMAKEMKETKLAVRRRTDVEPWHFADVEKMFEDWFEDFWSRPHPRLWRPTLGRLRSIALEAPALDVFGNKDDLIVKAEIPGLSKEDIDITIEGNTLTIKGQKKKEEEIKDEDYYRCERTFGAFSRSIDLPTEVKADKVNASFKDGVLEIRLPKTEEAKKNVVKVKVA
jgi:HSP20 family protein